MNKTIPCFFKRVAIASLLSMCAATLNFSVSVAAGKTNIAVKKPAFCSSTESAALGANLAVDSNISWASRWGSAFADSQWIYIDFGATYSIDSVALYWEHSGAKYFDLQTLKTGVTAPAGNDQAWTTIHHDSTYYRNPPVDMCLNFIKLSPVNTRYFRVRCLKRLWEWGYGIEELQVFGVPAGTPVSRPAAKTSTTPGLNLVKTAAGLSIHYNGVKAMSTEIYSPTGQMIRCLTGEKASVWNYKDTFGRIVTNGTYVLRVIASGKPAQGKVVLDRQ